MIKGRPETFDNYSCYDRCKENDKVVFFRKRKSRMKTEQVFYCSRCSLKFMFDDQFKNVFHIPEIITNAVTLYVRGLPGREVLNHVRELREVTVGESTVLKRVRTYEDQTRGEEKAVQIYL